MPLDETPKFTAFKQVVNILMENHHYRSDAEKLAALIVDDIYHDDGPEVLEHCHQCSGKKFVVVEWGEVSKHYTRVVCGQCMGTGKLSEIAVEHY